MQLKNKILITGVAGFIGFSLTEKLLRKKNIKIIGIDNLNSYYSKNLKLKKLKFLRKNKNFSFFNVDLIKKKKLKTIFKKNKFSIVINFAAQAGVRYSYANPKSYTDSNIIGFINLIEMVKYYNIKKFIFASSSSVYGEQKPFPKSEISEPNPINLYSLSKLSNELSPSPSSPQPPKSKDVAIATGTGFLFGSQDYIVTNYHVVKGTSEVKVKFTNDEMIDATVVARDIQNDVAVLKLTKSPSFQSREMKFGDSSMVRMGDEVFTIGYPHIGIMGLQPKYTKGVISAVTGIKDNPTVFQTTVPIQPGNSGGPLFNEKGEVIGLTTATLSLHAIESMGAVPQSVNYAVKSSFVKNTISTVPEALLSNRGIVVAPNESNSRSDFIAAIKKNVVLIVGKVD